MHYIAPKTTVVVAGSINEKKVLAQIRGYFDGLPRKKGVSKKPTKWKQRKPELMLKFKESDQSHLVLGLRAFDIFDKRRYALQVLSDVLGGGMSSRLFHKVREELGAAYYVNSGADLYLDHGYLAVSAGVDHTKIEKVLEVVLQELQRLATEPVPEKELQKSKDHLVGNFILGLETADELAGFYGEQEVMTKKISPPKHFIDKIRKVTAEEIQNVAKAIVKNERLNLAVIGPYKNSGVFRKILKL